MLPGSYKIGGGQRALERAFQAVNDQRDKDEQAELARRYRCYRKRGGTLSRGRWQVAWQSCNSKSTDCPWRPGGVLLDPERDTPI